MHWLFASKRGVALLNGLTALRVPGARAVFIACIAVTFSGCALLKSAPPPRSTYELTVPEVTASRIGGTPAQILVKQPNALKSIDSNRMVLRENGTEITYIAGTQWSDTVPIMVQAKLVAAFENTGATGATAKPGDGLVIDYQLIGDLRRFEIDNDSRLARLEMSIKLLSDRSGKVIETRIFSATAPVSGSEGSDYALAFDTAFAALSQDIIRWVLARV